MKKKMGTKYRTGNQVTDRARIQVTFCSQFSFSRSPSLVLLPSLLGALNSRKQTGQLNLKGKAHPFFLFHLDAQSQPLEVCILLCFRMPLTAKRK